MGRTAAWMVSLAHAIVFSASLWCIPGKSPVMPLRHGH